MIIQVKIWDQTTPLTNTDKLAISLNNTYNSEVDSQRHYKGFFTSPYLAYSGKEAEYTNSDKEVTAFCDKVVDGEAHSLAWRWWGKTAEVLIEELAKQNLEIKEK